MAKKSSTPKSSTPKSTVAKAAQPVPAYGIIDTIAYLLLHRASKANPLTKPALVEQLMQLPHVVGFDPQDKTVATEQRLRERHKALSQTVGCQVQVKQIALGNMKAVRLLQDTKACKPTMLFGNKAQGFWAT